MRQHRKMKSFLLEYRVYGSPKIHKPKCLKGMKPVLKLRCMKKPVDVYELGDGNVVVYFGSLFSRLMGFPEPIDMMLPYEAVKAKYPERLANAKGAKGFVYHDAWCTIYERNEGYVRIEGLIERLGDGFGVYFPQVETELFEDFRRLSLLDKGFCDIAAYDDMCAAEYRRCIEDIVQWFWQRAREGGVVCQNLSRLRM